MSPSYGIYSGYELCENLPASADNEEYLGSEKFELEAQGLLPGRPLAPLIRAVNDARRRHRAFANLRSLRFHASDNPDIMAYSKTSDDGGDVVLVVVTLDPYAVAEATLHLDTEALGLGRASSFEVYDELSGKVIPGAPVPM